MEVRPPGGQHFLSSHNNNKARLRRPAAGGLAGRAKLPASCSILVVKAESYPCSHAATPQVRVGDTPVQSSLQSAFGQSSNVAANPELCSPAASSTGGSSDHYLAVGRSPTAYDDPGALVVSCGSAGSLVSLGAMLGTAYEAWLIVQPVPAASRAVSSQPT